MTDKNTNRLLDAAQNYLTEQCNLTEAKNLEDLLTNGARGFLREPRVRLANHFDPDIDMLVFDEKLGALGIVRLLSNLPSVKDQQETIRQCLDQATYVRHLLASNCPENSFPLTVDLVLVPEETGQGEAIGEMLRELARDTGYLHAIGVNVLVPEATEPKVFRAEALRRAFSWLLPESTKWYASAKPTDAGGASGGEQKLTEIRLHNYRLPGLRQVQLASDARLHLIHGHNGSGKSSLAEALELVLTGKIQRLPIDADYAKAILNPSLKNGTPVEAKVTILRADQSSRDFVVQANGVDEPLADNLYLASFRLDQPLMDRLSRMGPGKRASVFLKAFFPEGRENLTAFETAKREAETNIEALPEEIKNALPGIDTDDITSRAQSLINRFGWLDNETPPDLDTLLGCLPLSMDDLQILQAIRPEFGVAEKWRTVVPAAGDLRADLESLDRGLETLFADRALPDVLNRARTVLTEQSDWLASGKTQGGDYAETLNSWLEHLALTDLLEKRLQFEGALHQARNKGWRPEPTTEVDETVLVTSLNAESLRNSLDTLVAKRDELYKSLKSFEINKKDDVTTKDAAVLRKLTAEDISVLNRVGEWICPRAEASVETAPLGEALNTARNQDIPLMAGKFELGKNPEWSAPLLERLERILAVYKKLIKLGIAGGKAFTSRIDRIKKAIEAHRKFETLGNKLQASLLGQMMRGDGTDDYGKLLRSLNELMALFTPARWAYRDIALPLSSSPDGKHRLDFTWGEEKKDAEFLLNTAELNLFTTALFLLFAPFRQNPLRLLILDDPLQNMDELTVSCVARGLAKLNRLWGENIAIDWQMLILFHGEEDLERFRREIPAALYHLPWLSPGDQGDCLITNERPPEMLRDKLQDPAEVFAERK